MNFIDRKYRMGVDREHLLELLDREYQRRRDIILCYPVMFDFTLKISEFIFDGCNEVSHDYFQCPKYDDMEKLIDPKTKTTFDHKNNCCIIEVQNNG